MPVYNCINDKCDQNFTKPTSLLRHLNRRKYKSKGCDFPCCVTKDFNWNFKPKVITRFNHENYRQGKYIYIESTDSDNRDG